MFEIKFDSPTVTRLVARLEGLPERVQAVLSVRLRALMFQLAGKIQSEKLSGQVLKVRTGILRASVHATDVTTSGTIISGGVEAAQGPAFYGKFHEVGIPHAWQIVSVKARALAFISHGKQVYAKSVIHPPMKQRAFARPALEESAQSVHDALQAAVDAEMKK
jgi:hypothetical protein